jgi:DNA topoisomerase-3
MLRGKFSYGCSGFAEGCDFRVGTVICSRVISLEELSALLTDGKTPVLDGFISKRGKAFSARLVIKDKTATFEFN